MEQKMEDQLWYDRLPDLRQTALMRRSLMHLLLTLQLIALLPLASCSSPQAGSVASSAANVQPFLLSLAQEEPDLTPRLIVQFSGDLEALTTQVRALGGSVINHLWLIGAMVIDLPAGQITRLAAIDGVRWISLDAPVFDSGEKIGEEVLLEEFSLSNTASTRVVNWRWYEIGEDDGMEAGDVLLTHFFGGKQEGLRIQNGGKGIQTSVDLALSSQATMNLSFRRKSFEAGDAIRIEVSTDHGASWQLIDRTTGPVTDSSLQISAYNLSQWAGQQIQLRFMSEPGMSAGARFYLDFVQVRHTVIAPDLTHAIHLPYITGPQPDTITELEVWAAGSVLRVRDEFNAATYSNNNGNVSWSTPWIERDLDGTAGPIGGDYVGIVNNALRFHYAFQNYEEIRRSVNLVEAQSAVLSFNWQTFGLDIGERLSLLIATNRNGPFTLLTTFDGHKSGTYSLDISGYRSADTTIRFANLDQNWEWGEWVSIDNVQIEWTVAAVPAPTPTPVPICTDCIDTTNLQTIYPQVVGASDVWNESIKKQGQGVTIAILDSGIAEHPDLTNKAGHSRIVARVDFTNGGVIDDFYGHGTHVAGAAAGNGKQSYGSYIGVAPEAKLIDVKVTNDYGAGTTSGVVAGLQWVFENKDLYKIRVVNMSLNSTVAESYHNNPLSAAMQMLWFSGVVVVVSSGNNGDNADAGIIYPPANDPYVITVGATDDKSTVAKTDDIIAPYTAYGYTNDGFMKPEVIVPGTDIIAPLASDDANLAVNHPAHVVTGPNGSYYFRMSGTSMAAGVAAGVVALLLSNEPNLTPDAVKGRLMSTGAPVSLQMGASECVLTTYYNGKLTDGWENWSWGGSVNEISLMNNAKAWSVHLDQPWAALSLRANNWINPGDVTAIRFWAYGAGTNGTTANRLQVYTYADDSTAESPNKVAIDLVPNVWQEYTIPISALGNISDIKRITIQDRTGAWQPAFHIDNIRLVGNCTQKTSYLDIRAAVRSTNTTLANQDVMPHMLLAKMAMIAYWASQNGDETIDWASVNWNSVNWNSVNWNSVNWNSVNWNSVNWNSVNWNSVNWNSVNWNSVNWNSVNWNSVNWNSVNWNSVNWNSVKRNSTEFDE
ncbi:S8 family serine peptidase [bacterium]|nr:S8 family serine peptidase [bacterium]